MSFVAGSRRSTTKTFKMVLKEPYGLVLEFARPSPALGAAVHHAQAHRRDRSRQADRRYIGSGPFIFKKDEWKPGEKTVYVRNPDYKPRAEPPSGLAGGKVAKLDRVEWVVDPRPPDRGQRPARGRDRHDRGAAARPAAGAAEGQERRSSRSDTSAASTSSAELADAAVQQREDPPRRHGGARTRRTSCRPSSATSATTRSARRCSPAARRWRARPAWRAS